MESPAIIKDAEWFKVHSQLSNSGVNPKKLSDKASESIIKSYFGPKAGKNGWRFSPYVFVEQKESIVDLYS